MKRFLAFALVLVVAGCDAASTDASALETADAQMASASANAAFVSNSGRDDQTCTLSGDFFGSGSATLVANAGGNLIFQCSGSLADGSATTDRTIREDVPGPFGTTCALVVTPAGRFSAVCN